jgi:fructose-1,6-bisphosphatase/inositol monophosphatase family enzyme
VAEGVLDAYMVVGRSTLYGWDYLAGYLICTEAGASAEERAGAELVVRDDMPRRPVVAATRELVGRLMKETDV